MKLPTRIERARVMGMTMPVTERMSVIKQLEAALKELNEGDGGFDSVRKVVMLQREAIKTTHMRYDKMLGGW